jgi:hypothetical protein
MQCKPNITHSDGIWISDSKERHIVKTLSQRLVDSGFEPESWIHLCNFSNPYIFNRNNQRVNCRLVDSVFITDPDLWGRTNSIIITDNYPIKPVQGKLILLIPEFWSIWRFDPVYRDRPARLGYNCFMNRARGDRNTTFYELIRRNILSQGLVIYNCSMAELDLQYTQAELQNYSKEHQVAKSLTPYNTVELHGPLEQCIIDSNISLILETYTSDSHIVFSEKLFRCLQMPRPWLLYCSPGSISLLKQHGFDVLDDVVDTEYDRIDCHVDRLMSIINQLETFIDREYTDSEYERFYKSSTHNQQLLQQLEHAWPNKFADLTQQIQQL